MVPGVIKHPLPDKRETLARGASEHYVYSATIKAGCFSDFFSGKTYYGAREDGSMRKVEMMYGSVDRIDLDSRRYIEPGLLESERHSARACKQIDADGATTHPRNS
jgi:hypothetical protein